jgi:superfamily II DNA or RNA helicase
MWDGKHRLYNVSSGEIYVGLLPYILQFAKMNKLTVDRPENLLSMAKPITPSQTVKFIHSLDLPYKPHDYQAKTLHAMINNRRKLIISPTSSGKSFMIYMTCRYWERIIPEEKKILLIVPTTSLVSQMCGDFAEYSEKNGWNVDEKCHKIYDGAKKITDKKLVVSTWQSIYKMPRKWFLQFAAVIGDEAHNFAAKEIGSIIKKCDHIPYRMGTTGTVGDEQVNRLTLEGMFGPQLRTISTLELMDRGTVARLTIKSLQLKWNDLKVKRDVNRMDYNAEKQFLITNIHRTNFTAKLAVAQKKNTLILYENKVHGKAILDKVTKMVENDPSRKIYFFNGDVGVKEREAARPEIEKLNGCIIIASLGVFSTGVSIKNIHSIIFAWIGKSSIRVLQSIGRGLRVSETKDKVTLYDIFDNIRFDGRRNYSLKHYLNRIDIYKSEGFNLENKIIDF